MLIDKGVKTRVYACHNMAGNLNNIPQYGQKSLKTFTNSITLNALGKYFRLPKHLIKRIKVNITELATNNFRSKYRYCPKQCTSLYMTIQNAKHRNQPSNNTLHGYALNNNPPNKVLN